jgi:hypothetical protein
VVVRLSGCLGALGTVERRVLVLRTGLGDARPHSRRGVARLLDVRVRRVVRIERRGLREARSLARAGACSRAGGGSSGTVAAPTALAAGGGGDDGGGGLVPEPDTDNSGAQGGQDASGGGSAPGSGDVRGESETQLPPPLGNGNAAEPGGISLAIGIFLILLALLAGFAAPHVRGRLRSS